MSNLPIAALRQGPVPPDAGTLPLNCPHCGTPLVACQIGENGGMIYRCVAHGAFWFDDDGNLHEDRRSPDRPWTQKPK
jgi:predicted RNA-binding Zn-ribbon protein involved in translation (DUF1610 family)